MKTPTETRSTQHTPTPWYINRDTGRSFISPDHTEWNSKPIAEILPQYGESGNFHGARVQANAELIVRAVNSHEALISFAESFLTWSEQMRSVGRSLPGMEARENEARAALALARGEKA